MGLIQALWMTPSVHAQRSCSRAKELEAAATTAGFYGELDEAVHPYGSVEGFVRDKFKQASKRG